MYAEHSQMHACFQFLIPWGLNRLSKALRSQYMYTQSQSIDETQRKNTQTDHQTPGQDSTTIRKLTRGHRRQYHSTGWSRRTTLTFRSTGPVPAHAHGRTQ
jgi:hypothetical protein